MSNDEKIFLQKKIAEIKKKIQVIVDNPDLDSKQLNSFLDGVLLHEYHQSESLKIEKKRLRILVQARLQKILEVEKSEERKKQELIEFERNAMRAEKAKKEVEEQRQYLEKINNKYLSVRTEQDILIVLNNFIQDLPEEIFLFSKNFAKLESLLVKYSPVGQHILFSRFSKNIFEGNESQETENFLAGDFSRFTRLLGKRAEFESEIDCQFTALRLLQIGVVSHYAKSFAEKCTGIFKEIEELSLLESLFFYYKKCGDILGNIKQDPAIMLFAYYLIDKRKFGEVDDFEYFNVFRRRQELLELLEENEEEFKFRLFEEKMTQKTDNENAVTMQDVDLMTGEEFEHFVAEIFQKMGYRAEVTQLSGDYGIDVIAEKDGLKIGVQAKRYSGSVSNSAIQEVVAGMSYHECQKGVVVTNSAFTKAAVKLANANNIQLWDRKALEEKIRETFVD